MLEDALKVLQGLGSVVKAPMHVTFISEHGGVEAGIDQGGLLKEFLEEVSRFMTSNGETVQETLNDTAAALNCGHHGRVCQLSA